MEPIHISRVEPDRMRDLCINVLETQEIVRHLRRAGHLRRTVQSQHQQVHHKSIVLDDEGGELQSTDYSVTVGVVHILVVHHHIVLRRHVIGNVVIHNKPEKSVKQC